MRSCWVDKSCLRCSRTGCEVLAHCGCKILALFVLFAHRLLSNDARLAREDSLRRHMYYIVTLPCTFQPTKGGFVTSLHRLPRSNSILSCCLDADHAMKAKAIAQLHAKCRSLLHRKSNHLEIQASPQLCQSQFVCESPGVVHIFSEPGVMVCPCE